jgi:hypothetical protein
MEVSAAQQEQLARLDGMAEAYKHQGELAEEILKKDPRLDPIVALVMAGDAISTTRADAAIAAGEPFDRAAVMVGSYARLDWAVRQLAAGRIDEELLLSRWPSLWRGSDPDDTDPRFLEIWQLAYERAGGTVLDDPDRPLPDSPEILVYRGQDPGATLGIAWTLSRKIATAFAAGMATRQGNRGGVVLRAVTHSSGVLGYLTGRHEEEVVVDPSILEHLR